MRKFWVRVVISVAWLILARWVGAPEWAACMFGAVMGYLGVPERAK
ncbi:hypothetical protein [Mizugakiibacter sediminis]|nr:hypothetical protein [Mizugakiibacter sediminis]